MKLTFKERLESIRQTHDYRLEKAKLEFVRGISRLMAQHEISNAELARRLDSSPAYATKVMRGDSNFTLDSMVKISHALGSTLHVHVADSSADVRWRSEERRVGKEWRYGRSRDHETHRQK